MTMVGEWMGKLVSRRARTLLLLLCLGLCLAACAVKAGSQVHVKGTTFGEALEIGAAAPVPVQARVTCNGAAVTAAANGTFDLAVPQAKEYHCTASAPPAYNERSVTISGDLGRVVLLNFASNGQAVCSAFPSAADVECGTLP